jgi:hypothetical protein
VLAADDHFGHHFRSSPLKQIAAASAWIDSHRFVCRSSSAWTIFGRIPLLATTGCYPVPLPAALVGLGLDWPDLAACRRDWPASARISPATVGIDQSRPDLTGHRWDWALPTDIGQF